MHVSANIAYTPRLQSDGRSPAMTKYDYDDLRHAVERWSASEGEALDTWEKAEWKSYDEDPEGRYFDTIGDTAGHYFQATDSKKDELLGLIVLAETAENEGDTNVADHFVDRIYRAIATTDIPAPATSHASADPETEFDPAPPDVPGLSLLDGAAHDYGALRRAVERWEEAEESELDRWEAEREAEYDADPANHYFDTIGDGAGYRFQQIQSKVAAFNDRIREAEALERDGDMDGASQLVEELREDLGVTDDAAAQLDDFLFEKSQRPRSWRRRFVIAWIVAAVVAIVAALFNLFG